MCVEPRQTGYQKLEKRADDENKMPKAGLDISPSFSSFSAGFIPFISQVIDQFPASTHRPPSSTAVKYRHHQTWHAVPRGCRFQPATLP